MSSSDGYWGEFKALRFKDEVLRVLDAAGHGGLTAEQISRSTFDGLPFKGRSSSLRGLLRQLEKWGLVRHEEARSGAIYYLLRPGEHGYMGVGYTTLVDVSKMVR